MRDFAGIVIVVLVAGVFSIASTVLMDGDVGWWAFWGAVLVGNCVAVAYLRRDANGKNKTPRRASGPSSN